MQKRGEKPAQSKPAPKPASSGSSSAKQASAPAAPKPLPKPPPTDDVTDLKPTTLGRSSDEDLMRRTQKGDRQAFSLLYERYSASVLSCL